MDPHPLADFMHPDMHAFVEADPEKRGHHGVIADWLQERGHDTLAEVFRRHQGFSRMAFADGHLGPTYVHEAEHPLSAHIDSRGGKTTQLTYHRMRDALTGKKFHTVSLTHWRWWNPDPEGMNTGHAVHVMSPVTRKELGTLIKQYGGKKKSGLSPARDWKAYHAIPRTPGVTEFPMEHLGPDAQLAAGDIGGPQQPAQPAAAPRRLGGASTQPARPLGGGLGRSPAPSPLLPTRQSAGVSSDLPPPAQGPHHWFNGGVPMHRDEQGNQFTHRPQANPQAFHDSMQKLGTPESLHMLRAAQTGHKWDVTAGSYPHFAKYDPAALARMSGAAAGDDISFHVNPASGAHIVHVTGRGANSGKTVRTYIDHGKSELYLDTITGPGQGGGGWGSRYFFDALKGARKLGIKTIKAGHAIGEPGNKMWNGFYTWPRLGFNGPLPTGHQLDGDHARSKDFHELFDKPGGAQAWKRAGTESYNITFDTSPGSPHVQRLVRYLRGVQATRRQQGPAKLERDEAPATPWEFHESSGTYHTSPLPGIQVRVQTTARGDGAHTMSFDRKVEGRNRWTSEMTSDQGAKAVPIMRAVLNSAKSYLAQHKPSRFHFEAVKDEGPRVKLYDRAAPLLAEQHGYDLERRESDEFVHYMFNRREGK